MRAYRDAADELRRLDKPIRRIFEDHGREGLQRIPHIGISLSNAIATWLETGSLGILFRLRGEDTAERALMAVPGLGRELAHRIHQELHISTHEELERAAHDGRLAGLPGFGRRRVQAIQDQLDARLRRRAHLSARASVSYKDSGIEESSKGRAPVVAELLDVDQEYRELACRDRLPTIRPRRFNPAGEAWLPILHTVRGSHHYTVLFSNTARAHLLKRIRDWVVIYLDDGTDERQWTVVTERRGALTGKRVVRGREVECLQFYTDAPQ